MDMPKILGIIRQYEYGQYHLLRTRFEIEHNPWTQQLRIHPFFNYDDKVKGGACLELMLKAGNELRGKGFITYGAKGTSPDFFYLPEEVHYFLIISRQHLFKGQSLSGRAPEISLDDQLLADPSFKRVVPFIQSGYVVQQLMDPYYVGQDKHTLSLTTTLLLERENSASSPLGMTKEGHIVEIRLTSDSANPLAIVFRNDPIQYTNAHEYNLHDPRIDSELKGNERLLLLVKKLRQKKIKETDQHLKANSIHY